MNSNLNESVVVNRYALRQEQNVQESTERQAMLAAQLERDLLLYAAKASGITLARPQDYDDRFRNVTGMGPLGNLLAAPVWNPLVDDGDAFRLAIKLNLWPVLEQWSDGKYIVITLPNGSVEAEKAVGNLSAVARLVITHAAAEIGKAG